MRFRKFLKPYKTRGSSFREHTLLVAGVYLYVFKDFYLYIMNIYWWVTICSYLYITEIV